MPVTYIVKRPGEPIPRSKVEERLVRIKALLALEEEEGIASEEETDGNSGTKASSTTDDNRATQNSAKSNGYVEIKFNNKAVVTRLTPFDCLL